ILAQPIASRVVQPLARVDRESGRLSHKRRRGFLDAWNQPPYKCSGTGISRQADLPSFFSSTASPEAILDKTTRNNQPASRVRRSAPDPNSQRANGAVDQGRIRTAVREILLAIGEDVDREGLRDTPERVARLYVEMFSGLGQNPRDILKKTFTQKYDE